MRHPRDLSYLRFFLEVAEQLSFRRAADRLNVAQPAVTRAVQQLEAALGYRLLERTTRTVTLTPAGEVLYRKAAEGMSQILRAAREAGQVAAGTAGEIVIAYSAQAANGPMPELVVRFRNAFPDAQIGLYSLSSDEQVRALEEGRTDVGFLLSEACRVPLEHTPITSERLALLTPIDHPWAGRAEIDLRELAEEPFVLGSPRRWGTFRSLIDSACLKVGFRPRVVEEADDVPLLLQLVSLGRGITVYNASVRASLPPSIAYVPISDADAELGISLAWRANPTPLVTAFVKLAKA